MKNKLTEEQKQANREARAELKKQVIIGNYNALNVTIE